MPKPFTPAEVEMFARDARQASDASPALHRVVASLAREVGLSDREEWVVFQVAAGVAHDSLAAQLAISPTTIRTYVRRAVAKSERGSWRALKEHLLGEVFRVARSGHSHSS